MDNLIIERLKILFLVPKRGNFYNVEKVSEYLYDWGGWAIFCYSFDLVNNV